MTYRNNIRPIAVILAVCIFSCISWAQLDPRARELRGINSDATALRLQVSDGTVTIRALSKSSLEVVFEAPGNANPPSAAIADSTRVFPASVSETEEAVTFSAGDMRAVIRKSPFNISYFHNNKPLLAEEQGYFVGGAGAGFRFSLQPGEILMGGGSRVLGMDRRGQRLELYNKPAYGYETEAPLMYYSMPVVMSSAGYLIVFDNGARGFADLGKTHPDILEFSAQGGRMSYIVIGSDDWQGLTTNLTDVTGRQPLPPRWALGNISSRMGYRSQAEVEWVADGYRVKDIPLDAIVLDLYWFGPDLKGHMGNLEWDRNTFPEPGQMMKRLRQQGIKTILITEPFVLKTSSKFEEVAARNLLGTTAGGEPYTYEFYFGTTGLLDIFKPETRDWFWNIYRDLTKSGVAGWWGDLGEPEVHPDDLYHVTGRATSVHNLYGHEWARTIADGYARDFPDERPMILMRAGFVGSQRYGMIPWTGDVNRTWEGLQPQVEISLQMGMQGLAYMHSDLGGFAGDYFDPELYTRWLQYGTFQPVYRPHAQENVPPEPIFWDTDTLANIRPFIKLRYALAPYNYTLAYLNSTTGLPMMRPMFYIDDDPELLTRADGYLWGDAFLVYPVTEAELTEMDVYLPKQNVWFDYFTGERYEGGQTVTVETPLDRLPVFVRAGSWVPMIPEVHSLDAYPYHEKVLHYWHDATIEAASGLIYEDDGLTRDAHLRQQSEIIRLNASADPATSGALSFGITREGNHFPGRSDRKQLTWVVHNWNESPQSITVDGQPFTGVIEWDEATRKLRFRTTLARDRMEIHIR